MQGSMYFSTHLQGIFSPRRPFPPLGRCYQPASPCQVTEDPSWHLLPRGRCSALYCDAWALTACRNSAMGCQGTLIVPIPLEASSALASGLISHGKSEETTMGGFLCKALRKGAPAGPKARCCSAPSAWGPGGTQRWASSTFTMRFNLYCFEHPSHAVVLLPFRWDQNLSPDLN